MSDVVLAFSGGLDTSYCLLYLRAECGMRVHTVTVDTGGFTPEEKTAIERRARELGAASHTTLDGTTPLYEHCLRYLVFGNVLRYGTYPLSVSAERAIQARLIAQHARQLGARALAHGSTGAGNDQIRFDAAWSILAPELEILTPIRDGNVTREQALAYLHAHGVALEHERPPYSINRGIWGTTVGGHQTLTSHEPLPDDAFPTPITAHGTTRLTLHFIRGELVGFDGTLYEHPLRAIAALEETAAPWGVGRGIHVGDTIVGTKGRVGFQAAAAHLTIAAHHALEKHTLTKWQLLLKEQLAIWYGQLLHEGMFEEPALRAVEAFFERTQRTVTGDVIVQLSPKRYEIEGVISPHDLMHARFGRYGEQATDWNAADVRGFARIAAEQLRIFHTINGETV
ncbi:MAG: argininosuccinate synthase [Candidatus Kapaibacterium sp.]|nr:MAG: argininosuccinate synthase [Candidatus Kapabacteria bacterium]